MALQDILKKIIEEAEAVVAQIKADAEKEKEQLNIKSDEIQAQEIENLEAQQKEAEAKLEQKTRSLASRENANDALTIKQTLINRALESFCENLEQSDDKLYESILSNLAPKITIKKGTVLVPKKRLDITKKLLQGNFDFQSDDTIKGGFLIRDGGAEIDCTFQNMIFSEYRGQLTSFFAKKLSLL